MSSTSPGRGGTGDRGASPRVQLLHVPDCPLVEQVRPVVLRSLQTVGVDATVEEAEGPYPSPTLLIDGVDVTGRSPGAGPSCRLDLPVEAQITGALRRALDKQ